MSLKVKKQFPEFDINEYTDEKDLTVDEAIIEIKNFDWVNESLKSSKIIEEHAHPSIWFRNQSGDTFTIGWADTDKFAIYYSEKGLFKRSSTSIVNGYEEAFELIRLFDTQTQDLLLRQLKSSEHHFKTPFILDFFSIFVSKGKTKNSRELSKEEYSYEVKYSTVLKKLTFSFVFILLPTIVGVILPSKPGARSFNWTDFLGFQGFCTLFALPAIIITINHLKRNGNWTVHFRKRENIFFIVSSNGKEMFDKSDFKNRIVTTNDSNAPWNNYEYTTLVKNDGRQIHFSNLLLPSSDMDKLFGRIDETRVKSGFQIIKDKKIKD